MYSNKYDFVQIKEKYKHFIMNSVFLLTLQIDTTHSWMGVEYIASSEKAIQIHITTFYPYVNVLKTTAKLQSSTVKMLVMNLAL